jgi:uncharacterized protein (TIGR02996 family)
MPGDAAFLGAIEADPGDAVSRLVYADWLDERDDRRGTFLRLHLALRSLPPDHPYRVGGEQELSILRQGLDLAWLAIIEPERAYLHGPPTHFGSEGQPYYAPNCDCFDAGYNDQEWPDLDFHNPAQDTECDAWKRLLDEVENAAASGQAEFAPGHEMEPEDWRQLITLPPTIAKLKSVERLYLYGSHLVRIPPEIGEMTSLREFDPYTSYRLHWFPYEITRCPALADSRVSTRAIYGNFKYRPPFPSLHPRPIPPLEQTAWPWPLAGAGQSITEPNRPCSVCRQPFVDRGMHRVWISLRVATDVLPLLVNACSEECIGKLPPPADNYVPEPHRGGRRIQQPPTGY